MISTGRSYSAKGVTMIRGEQVFYHTCTEEHLFMDDLTGAKAASAWTFAYLRDEDGTNTEEPQRRAADSSADGAPLSRESRNRPVIFAYNGGPGCSSLPLHAALLAPERAFMGDSGDLEAGREARKISVAGPYKTAANAECLLDIADIVCIDPVGTGYGRIFDEAKKAEFSGTENDCIAAAQLISRWLAVHGRYGSPVYLCGESYGTTRSALTADYLYSNPKGEPGIHVSGLIMIGSAMDHGQEQYQIFRAVLTLPTLAATYRFHHPGEVSESLADFVSEAMEFAWNDYARARLYGSFLSDEERREIAERVRYFTGVDVEYLLRHDLEIDSFSYKKYLYDREGFFVSNYDTRFAQYDVPPVLEEQMANDGMDSCVSFPAMLSAYYNRIKPALGIEAEEEYRVQTMEFAGWEFRTKVNPLRAMEAAMQRNKDMRVFFAAGIYDLLTTWGYVRYVQSHNHYPADRVKAKYYPSGHMIYLSDDCARELLQDMRGFLSGEE